jgi:hypothetical protein
MGRYHAQFKMSYGPTNKPVIANTGTFWYVSRPILFLGIGIVVVLLALLTWFIVRRIRRRKRKAPKRR